MLDYYKAEKIHSNVTAIRSLTGEIMYLIEGNEYACLIDTCLGIGNLKQFVENLTTKPMKVLLTHGHIDHAMGAPEFYDVSMNSADEPVYLSMNGIAGRMDYIRGNLRDLSLDISEKDLLAPQPLNYHPLKDGDTLDLGGIHVESHSLPGHTKGTMIFLIKETGDLILGDGCNTVTFLFDENSLSVEAYQNNLCKAASRLKGRYQKVFACHHVMNLDIHIMENVINVCQDILDEKTDDVPFEFMGHKAFIAKKVNENFQRIDGLQGNIIYSKDKVRKK